MPIAGVLVELYFDDERFGWHRIDAPGSLVVLLEGEMGRAVL